MKSLKSLFFALALFTAVTIQAAEKNLVQLEKNFKTPTKEYLPLPLWHLNGQLSTEIIQDQMTKAVLESGFGGFCLLPVRSTKPAYLSEEYFDRYSDMLETAKKLDMRIVFYDDIDFPTGSAGGKLQANFPNDTVKQLNKIERIIQGPTTLDESIPEGSLMSIVAMNTDSLERIDLTDKVSENKLQASLPEGTWRLMYFVCIPSGHNLVDFLNPDSVKKFISLTYDEYYRRFSKYFGKTIFMTFFDDVAFPQVGGNGGYRMWTPIFNETFKEKFGYSPTSLYPALWYDIGEDTAQARVAMHRVRADMLSENWVKQIADWAQKHDVVSIGHPMDNYNPQAVNCSGDNLKFYKYMDCPLMDSIHYYGQGRDGFKQIGSASYNYDKPVTVVEIYGNYPDKTFDANMLYRSGMELFIRGANFFLPHGTWLDEKSVYIPPEISWRNPRLADTLPHYNQWAARISMLLQGGRHIADTAILYPIASLQANYRMDEPQANGSRFGLYTYPECDFQKISHFLVDDIQRDFTFIHPEVLDEKCLVQGNTLHLSNKVNYEDYKILIIPGGNTIHWSNVQKIKEFYENGGIVIGTTQLPYLSAEPGHNADVDNAITSIFGPQAKTLSLSNLPDKRHLKLEVQGNLIKTWIDGILIDTTLDDSFSKGKIGFRQATHEKGSFDNVSVTAADGTILFSDDFSSGLGQWENIDHNTRITNGILYNFENEYFRTIDGSDWNNYTIECDFSSGSSVVGFSFRITDSNNFYMWQISNDKKTIAPHKRVNGVWHKMKIAKWDNLESFDKVTPYTRMNHPNGGKAFFIPVPTGETLREIMDNNIIPDVSFPKIGNIHTNSDLGMLSYLHKIKDGLHLWFIANSTDSPISTPVTLSGKHSPKIWDPETGEIVPVGYTHTSKKGHSFTEVNLVLPPVTALFLVSEIK